MVISKNQELLLVEQLYEQGKCEEALQVIINFEQVENLTEGDKLSCHLLKGYVLVMLGRYNEALTLADQAIKESQKLGKKLQIVDALILKGRPLWWLGKLDHALDLFNQAEKILSTITKKKEYDVIKREGWIAWGRSVVYFSMGERDQQIEFLQLGVDLWEKIGYKYGICHCLMLIGYYYRSMGDFDRSLIYSNRSMKIAKDIHNELLIAYNLGNFGFVSLQRGDLDNSLHNYEEALSIFNKYNKPMFSGYCLINIGVIYELKGDLKIGLNFYKKALALYEINGNLHGICDVLVLFIDITIEMGDFKQAKQYFQRLEQINEVEEDKLINLVYRANKAKLFKYIPSNHNQIKAREIYEQIIKEDIISIMYTIEALIELSDLLLINLRDTNNLKLLNEIQPLINQLMENAKNQHSYLLLAETYILQAKLELLILDMKAAQKSYAEALRISKMYGFNQLLMRIVSEQEDLQKQLTTWESFKASKSSINERLDLAEINEQIVHLLRKRLYLDKSLF
ncbi:MAG: tetratricopeptide repeat protein [Promethearchaeota archaeon]